MATVERLRTDIVDYIRLRMGDGMIDIEADKEHYEVAIDQALRKYRQRAPKSQEESYAFLSLTKIGRAHV